MAWTAFVAALCAHEWIVVARDAGAAPEFRNLSVVASSFDEFVGRLTERKLDINLLLL